MLKIDQISDIVIDGSQNVYEIDLDGDLHIDLKIERDCSLFIRIKNVHGINIEGGASNGAKVSILFWNETSNDVVCNENYHVSGNSELTIAYGECNKGNMLRNVEMDLDGNGSTGQLLSASLVDCRKTYNMKLVNKGLATLGNIRNYAVVLAKGRLLIDAVGKICKGASRSRSHQTSRALAFAKGQSASILPELLIDENDVQASHAMSIGKVDDQQLYYMMSRGLDLKECTMLISLGYLMPVIDLIEEEGLRQALQQEMERKIKEICSM